MSSTVFFEDTENIYNGQVVTQEQHKYLQMLPNCRLVSTVSKERNEDAWKHTRSRGIGGSDIGAICGISNFTTPRHIYLAKTGQYQENFTDAAKQRMRWGNLLEPVVADEFARNNPNYIVINLNCTVCHKDYPWALANIDRLVFDRETGKLRVLEVKTAGEFMNDEWDGGEIPISYQYQLNWYLFVLGLDEGDFASLVGGNKFYSYPMYRSQELIDIMFDKAKTFWFTNVRDLIEPPVIAGDKELLGDVYAEVIKGSEVTLPDEIDNEKVIIIQECKRQIKELEAIQEEAENWIKDKLKTAEIAYTRDYTVKWSAQSQRRVDSDKLKSQFPQIYEQCIKIISFRTMRIKGGANG